MFGEWQREPLQALLARGPDWPHAILLQGLPNIGKREFAHAFAAGVLCQQASDGLACGQCQACRLVQAGTHPDLFIVVTETSAEGKRAQEIKIDQIRELCAALAKTSQLGGHQLAIIEDAERMNRHAANSLLKTLEEPTPNTLIVLVSSRISGLPATVRSRCQHLRVPAPTSAEVLTWLQQRYPEQDAAALFAAGEGAPKMAALIAEQELLPLRTELFTSLLAVAERRKDPFTVAANWHKSLVEPLLPWLLSWMRDLVTLSVGREVEVLNQDLRQDLQRVANSMRLEALLKYYDQVMRTMHMLTTNANPQLLLETLLLQWAQLTTAGSRQNR